MNRLKAGRLENWLYDERGVIWGNLYDDEQNRWRDGQHIHTSYVEGHKNISFREGMEVKTLNSIYILGSPFKLC